MSDIAISVQNLSKRYRIGKTEVQTTKRRSITRRIASPFQYLYSTLRQPDPDEVIWALKDVSFEVKRGEVLGVIGRNGAGKSTLLKILSRITEPTYGRAILNGRVGSLLEVGTGFHPELTGRENIYLSGAILGMKKTEIDRKFDEIVDFSGVEKFIDTPVKRYSSGMRVRLAFSVAAHLDTEILLVDEVLAVGDVAFQKKCLGKMGDFSKIGRTVIFVSHNMPTVEKLCPRVLWLADGIIKCDEVSHEAIGKYLSSSIEDSDSAELIYDQDDAPGDDSIRVMKISSSKNGIKSSNTFDMDENIIVAINFKVIKKLTNFHFFLNVYNSDGILVFGSASWDSIGLRIDHILLPGIYSAKCKIPPNFLNRGKYYLSLNGQIPGRGFIFIQENILRWEITEFNGAGGAKSYNRSGIVRPKLNWHFVKT